MATLVGTAGNDSLTGTSGNDSILGGDGNDTIAAGAGNDTISGNLGTDWVEGGLGNDQVSGGSGQDSFVLREGGASNADVLFDFASTWDNIQLDAAFFSSIGASGRFASGDVRFYAAAGATAGHDADDRIIFNTTTRQIFYDADGNGGGAAQLIATLPAGRSVVASDFWVFGTPPGQTGATPGDDSLVGTSGNDTIDGLAGNDTIRGLGGNDSLIGGDGNDLLDGGAETDVDTLSGGLGNDTFMVDRSDDVTVDSGGVDTVIATNTFWGLDSGFENLVLRSSISEVQGWGNELNNVITSEGGPQFGILYLDGVEGNDTLVGSNSAEWFTFSSSAGNYGNDSVTGGGGLDTLDLRTLQALTVDMRAGTVLGGGPGSSITFSGIERVLGSGGADRITGDDTGRELNGSAGDDTIIGGAGADSLWGDGGADHPDTLEGNDSVSGGAGNDVIFGGHGDDTLDGGAGDDSFGIETFFSDYGDDVISGGLGTDSLRVLAESAVTVNLAAGTLAGGGQGGGGSASLSSIENFEVVSTGGTFHDRVTGSSAANILQADVGNDTLDGLGGNDSLTGGAGADAFTFTVSPGAANADRITDFASGADKIVLDASVHANLGASGNFAAGDERFHAGATAQETDDRVIYNASTGQLWYDADGSGSGGADLIATLQAGATVVATNILVDNGSAPPPSGGQTINGTAGNDSLVGTSGNDTINGLGGNDAINGFEGADSLIGGDDNDTMHAGLASSSGDSAADTLDGGLGNDEYHVSSGEDTILPDPGGIDTVFARGDWTLGAGLENLEFDDTVGAAWTGTGNELDNRIVSASEGGSLFGMGGNDVLILANAFNSSDAHGGDGNDTLEAARASSLFGDAGNDLLRAGFPAGMTTMTGGAGDDSFVFESFNNTITDFATGSDKIRLDAEAMTALGTNGNFSVGDERFHVGASAAETDDRVIYDSAGRLWYDADGSGSSAASLVATLQAGATLVATDIAVDNGSAPPPTGGQTINGTAGNDSLVGTSGNDTVNGLAGNDTLRGLEGDDLLDGGDGIDSLDGGLGNDTYVVTTGDVIAADAGGTDTVQTAVSWNISAAGTLENVTIVGTANTDTHGNNLANVITGNDANNYVNARGGHDTIFGNGGNDYIVMQTGGAASFGEDWISGGAGIDTVDYAAALSALVANLDTEVVSGGEAGGGGSLALLGMEKFIGGGFADWIGGNSAQNNLTGNGGNDTLLGLGANDLLTGGDGNDRLQGGTGFDSLTGSAGADSFVFAETAGTANADRITDFVAGTDELLFENGVLTALGAEGAWAAGDGRFHAAAGAVAGADAGDRLVYNTTNGNLYYDADGAGGTAAQLVATLANLPALAAGDITVI